MPPTMPTMVSNDLHALLGDEPPATFQPARDIRRRAQHGKFFCYVHTFDPFVSALTGTQARQQFTVDGQTVGFAVQRIVCLADNLGDKVLLTASPAGEQFMFDPLYLAHLGGGQFPLNITPAWLLGKNGILTATVTDTKPSGAGNNTIRIAYFGSKLYRQPIVPARRYAAAKHFFYPANFTAFDSGQGVLTANQVRSYTVRIDADSDFEVQKITVVSNAAVLVQIQSDSDDWFDTDLRGELLGGSLIEVPVAPQASGWHPFILPAPRIVTAAGYIKVRVTNTVAANVNCEVQLHGTRLYPAGGLV